MTARIPYSLHPSYLPVSQRIRSAGERLLAFPMSLNMRQTPVSQGVGILQATLGTQSPTRARRYDIEAPTVGDSQTGGQPNGSAAYLGDT